MEVSIGSKIRFFRKKANFSQLDLENAINTSTGSISRIENNLTIPTRETLLKISRVLNLNFTEQDYFLKENYFVDPSEEEIQKAIEESSKTLENKMEIAYLLDQKHRIWAVSDTMLKMFKMTKEQFNKDFKGISLFEAITNPNLPQWKTFDLKTYDRVLEIQCARQIAEYPFWELEEYWVNLFGDLCRRFKHFDKAFNSARKDINNIDLLSAEARTVRFKLFGFRIAMNHSQEKLNSVPNFTMVLYHTENRFVRLLQKNLL